VAWGKTADLPFSHSGFFLSVRAEMEKGREGRKKKR